MPIAIILAALVIVGGVIVVALGRGGELTRDASDEPGQGDFESSSDVAAYRPPPALLGYHAGATEHALQLIARAIADRDAEISWLRGRLRELQPEGERREGTLHGLPDPAIGRPAGQPGPGLAGDPTDHGSPVAGSAGPGSSVTGGAGAGSALTGSAGAGSALTGGAVQGSGVAQDSDAQRRTVASASPVAFGSTAKTGDEG